MILVRLWRDSPESLTFKLPFGRDRENEQSTQTAQVLQEASASSFSPDTAWLRAKTNLRVYAGPGEEYPGVAWLEDNQQVLIIGKNVTGDWWSIELPYIQAGSSWVPSSQVEITNTSQVPVVNIGPIIDQPTPTRLDYPRARAIANINIRSGPDMRYQKIGTLNLEETAEITAISPDGYWYLIKVPGSENLQGWISKDYVITQNADDIPVLGNLSEAEATIEAGSAFLRVAATVNVRSGPDVTYAVIGQLKPDQIAEIVGKNPEGSWWAITFLDTEVGGAWVAADYVQAENTPNVPVLK